MIDVDKRIAELAAEARPLLPLCDCGAARIAAQFNTRPNHAGTCPASDDNAATLRLVHALRADPDRDQVMRVLAALAAASQGLPIHYTWNKLWWLLYVPEPAKPKPTSRKKKKR